MKVVKWYSNKLKTFEDALLEGSKTSTHKTECFLILFKQDKKDREKLCVKDKTAHEYLMEKVVSKTPTD